MKKGAMDPQKDLNISGNRVVNVADPTETHHMATNNYVDFLHLLTPDSDLYEYVRYINLRRDTQYSLTRLCRIKWTIEWTVDKGKVKETTGPFNLLESEISPTILLISPQELTDKIILLKYRFDVHVISWRISFTKRPVLDFAYIWEVSNDYETWDPITTPAPIETLTFKKRIDGNDGEMIFTNNYPAAIRAKYWRVKITAGKLEKDFYVNQICMELN